MAHVPGGAGPPGVPLKGTTHVSTPTSDPAITHHELARMRVLAELHDAGTLAFGALLARLSTDRTFESDIPLAPLLRILEEEGLVGTRTGHPRRYFLRPSGRAELHALTQAAREELTRSLERTGRLAAGGPILRRASPPETVGHRPVPRSIAADHQARAPPRGAAANRRRRRRPSGRGDTFSGRPKNRRRDSVAAATDSPYRAMNS